MQDSIKQAMQQAGYSADEIAAAFKKYGDYATVQPVIAEGVIKSEAGTPASIMRGLLRTSGGTLTTPTIIGSVAGGVHGGPIGLALGGTLGALGSPTGAGVAGMALKQAGKGLSAGLGGATPATSIPAALSAANPSLEIFNTAKDKPKGNVNQRNAKEDKQDSINPVHSSDSTPTDPIAQLFKSIGGNDAEMANLFGSNAGKKNTEKDVVSQIMPHIFSVESSGNPKAIGRQTKYGTAKGLGQLLDSTGREWHAKLKLPGKYDPFNQKQNQIISTAYFRWLLGKFDDDVKLALAAYNHGIGNVQQKQKALGESYASILPKLPDETKNYVAKIYGKYSSKSSA
jgi:soluble lytic murein transglycosylase-like protein